MDKLFILTLLYIFVRCKSDEEYPGSNPTVSPRHSNRQTPFYLPPKSHELIGSNFNSDSNSQKPILNINPDYSNGWQQEKWFNDFPSSNLDLVNQIQLNDDIQEGKEQTNEFENSQKGNIPENVTVLDVGITLQNKIENGEEKRLRNLPASSLIFGKQVEQFNKEIEELNNREASKFKDVQAESFVPSKLDQANLKVISRPIQEIRNDNLRNFIPEYQSQNVLNNVQLDVARSQQRTNLDPIQEWNNNVQRTNFASSKLDPSNLDIVAHSQAIHDPRKNVLSNFRSNVVREHQQWVQNPQTLIFEPSKTGPSNLEIISRPIQEPRNANIRNYIPTLQNFGSDQQQWQNNAQRTNFVSSNLNPSNLAVISQQIQQTKTDNSQMLVPNQQQWQNNVQTINFEPSSLGPTNLEVISQQSQQPKSDNLRDFVPNQQQWQNNAQKTNFKPSNLDPTNLEVISQQSQQPKTGNLGNFIPETQSSRQYLNPNENSQFVNHFQQLNKEVEEIKKQEIQSKQLDKNFRGKKDLSNNRKSYNVNENFKEFQEPIQFSNLNSPVFSNLNNNILKEQQKWFNHHLPASNLGFGKQVQQFNKEIEEMNKKEASKFLGTIHPTTFDVPNLTSPKFNIPNLAPPPPPKFEIPNETFQKQISAVDEPFKNFNNLNLLNDKNGPYSEVKVTNGNVTYSYRINHTTTKKN